MLADKAEKVIAVEKDKGLADYLKKEMAGYKNVEIEEGDILKLKVENLKLKTDHYIVVANLPYYITSPAIRKFLESDNPPREMYLMVQKEVAERICEKDGKSSILSTTIHFYAEPEILFYVSAKSFWPAPKIESAFIKIETKNVKRKIDSREFFKLVKIGFSSKRKKLSNNLAAGYQITKEQANDIIRKTGYDLNTRAESLKIQDWIKFFEAWSVQ